MPEYIVVRDQGWPVSAPTHKHFDVVELSSDAAKEDEARGYLIPVNAKDKRFTVEMATAVAEHRKRKADREAAAKKEADAAAQIAKVAAEARKKEEDELRRTPASDPREEQVQKILGAPVTTTPPPPPSAPASGE